VNSVEQLSIKENFEFFAWLYYTVDDAHGQLFGYTDPVKGGLTEVDANHGDPYAGAKALGPNASIAGDMHTHGDYKIINSFNQIVRAPNLPAALRAQENTFSGPTRNGKAWGDLAREQASAQIYNHYKMYLGTPGGETLRADEHLNVTACGASKC
jgi:hypothetical protein